MLTKEEEELGIDWRRNLRAEGRAEGLEAMRRLVLDQLSERFGPLSEDTEQRLLSLSSLDDLTDLGRRLVKADSLSELGL